MINQCIRDTVDQDGVVRVNDWQVVHVGHLREEGAVALLSGKRYRV